MKTPFFLLSLTLVGVIDSPIPAVETGLTFQLEEDWTFQAQSTLYSRPLAANVTVNPGMEIIICDAEVRLLRCIDASGRQLWQYDGG